MNLIKKLFKRNKRARLSDVKPGDRIKVEWSRISAGIGYVTCENNDPKTKRILISVRWSNYQELGVPEKEEEIWSYNNKAFKNFHLLNELVERVQEDEPEDEQNNDTSKIEL